MGGLYLDSDSLVLREDVLASLSNAYGSLHACAEMLKPQRISRRVRVSHGNNAVLRFTAGHYFLWEYMHAQVTHQLTKLQCALNNQAAHSLTHSLTPSCSSEHSMARV